MNYMQHTDGPTSITTALYLVLMMDSGTLLPMAKGTYNMVPAVAPVVASVSSPSSSDGI